MYKKITVLNTYNNTNPSLTANKRFNTLTTITRKRAIENTNENVTMEKIFSAHANFQHKHPEMKLCYQAIDFQCCRFANAGYVRGGAVSRNVKISGAILGKRSRFSGLGFRNSSVSSRFRFGQMEVELLMRCPSSKSVSCDEIVLWSPKAYLRCWNI